MMTSPSRWSTTAPAAKEPSLLFLTFMSSFSWFWVNFYCLHLVKAVQIMDACPLWIFWHFWFFTLNKKMIISDILDVNWVAIMVWWMVNFTTMNHKNSIFKIQFPYLGQGIFIDRQNIFTDKFFDGNKTIRHDSSSILRPQPVKRPVSVDCLIRGALGDGFFGQWVIKFLTL